MVKESARFHGAVLQAKGVVHDQDDIRVVRVCLGGHETAKDDKSLQTARAPRKFVNMGQTPRASFPLTCSSAEARHYFGPSGTMDAGRQIAVVVEIGQRHVIVRSGKCFRARSARDGTLCPLPKGTQCVLSPSPVRSWERSRARGFSAACFCPRRSGR